MKVAYHNNMFKIFEVVHSASHSCRVTDFIFGQHPKWLSGEVLMRTSPFQLVNCTATKVCALTTNVRWLWLARHRSCRTSVYAHTYVPKTGIRLSCVFLIIVWISLGCSQIFLEVMLSVLRHASPEHLTDKRQVMYRFRTVSCEYPISLIGQVSFVMPCEIFLVSEKFNLWYFATIYVQIWDSASRPFMVENKILKSN